MEPLPTFPLCPDPLRENVFVESADACDLCHTRRGWMYTGPTYGPLNDVKICPWCIADGTAESADVSFNVGTIFPYFDSTPQLPADDRSLVEYRTPGFQTWQGNHWLMHCGRACIYLGEADAEDLLGRWSSAVPSMFEGDGWPQDEIDDLVRHVKRSQGPCAYVFQCQICGALRGFWDIH
jgi:uncharacterized protein